ncbi:MAG: SAM-dependent methyltransferase [Burkholderiaceae bacterium]|nr:MAG: SAM-dependent methyltransferase [Burkholderiaceae bacterium]
MPEFETRDPLGAAFWDERFDKQFTPWTNGVVPQQLHQYLAKTPRQACLIPGCGHAYELSAFIQAQWSITAIDFSPSAVARARAMFPLQSEVIQQADFFEWQPQAPLQSIYERAFLCALPPERRLAIVQRWFELLASGGLLFGFFFIDEEAQNSSEHMQSTGLKRPKGPPFITPRYELDALMAGRFECIADEAISDSLPVFAGRERWQVWRRI